MKKSHATIPAACWRRNARQVVVGATRGWVEPVAAERRADRGRRDPYTKPEELALDALVAPNAVLRGEADVELLDVVVQW